ncbi:transcription initiation protein SPT3 homolog isoform X2 [Dysidea avara]|uniref:transcription initiation protein SPT3 homolog isoform X2 n=1 Tax=Dysidea avara TaxID=196820 RepID=UPI003333CC78
MENSTEQRQDMSFKQDISEMMYACGDYRHTSPNSAALLEGIVRKQLSSVVSQASELANQHGRRLISIQDIFFLLRRDKAKLKRAQRHMRLKEMAKKTRTTTSEEDDNPDSGFLKTSKSYSLDFLSSDEDSSDEMDSVTMARLERNDEMTRMMNVREYIEFTECRQTSFGGKNIKKFKEWLEPDSITKTKIAEQAWDLLAYLAYDTVQQVVELSLLVRKDMKSTIDPFNAHHLAVKRPLSFSVTNGGMAKKYKSSEQNGVTDEDPLNIQPISEQLPAEESVSSIIGGLLSENEDQSKEQLSQQQNTSAIQPYHIREAIRRCQMPGGTLVPFTTHHTSRTASQVTLCL